MNEYTFTDALGYSMTQLAEMDNRSFEQYYIPIHSTPTEMARYCWHNNVDLSSTVVMHEGDTFVGMSMLARRGQRGYVCGFGLVPEYRGMGAGKVMLAHTLEVVRTAGMRQLQLEALVQNSRAITLYENAGFVKQRELVGLHIAADAIPRHASNAQITPTEAEYIMDWLMQGQQPAWSRQRVSLLAQGGEAIVTSRPGGATAAMLYQRRGDTAHILATALIDRTSTNDLATMLRHAAEGVPFVRLQNQPQDSTLFLACQDLGFTEEYRQYEMKVELD